MDLNALRFVAEAMLRPTHPNENRLITEEIFHSEATPKTVIALLDAAKNYGLDADHARQERDAMQAENEILRAVLRDILAAGAIKEDEFPLLMARAKAALDGGGV